MSEHPFLPVREVMSARPTLVDGLATVREAMTMMRSQGVNSLVIRKRHDGDEYGLVVVSDIAEKVLAANRSPDRVNVYEIMSKPVITVDVKMNIKYAIRLLVRLGFSRALVVEEGHLVGLVTLRDLVFAYVPVGDPAAPEPLVPAEAASEASSEGVR